MKYLKPHLLADTFPALHGIRVLAIILVVNYHVAFYTVDENSLTTQISQRLWFGMDLFFVLSGFLIGNILIHGQTLASGKSLIRFYVRRAFRTFPLYYFVLAVLVMLDLYGSDFTTLWRELIYLTNYPHSTGYFMHWSWSLSLEEHFYFFAPLLLLLLKAPQKIFMAVILVLFIAPLLLRLSAANNLQGFSDFFTRIYTPTHLRFDTLIAGFFLAYLHSFHRVALQELFDRSWIRIGCPLIGSMLLVTAFWGFRLGITGVYGEQWLPGCFYIGTVTNVAYGLLILWLVYSQSVVHDVLSQPLFRYIATFGYGIYLVHIPIISVIYPIFRGLVGGHFLALGSTLVLALGISYLMHLVIEKPGLILRDKII